MLMACITAAARSPAVPKEQAARFGNILLELLRNVWSSVIMLVMLDVIAVVTTVWVAYDALSYRTVQIDIPEGGSVYLQHQGLEDRYLGYAEPGKPLITKVPTGDIEFILKDTGGQNIRGATIMRINPIPCERDRPKIFLHKFPAQEIPFSPLRPFIGRDTN